MAKKIMILWSGGIDSTATLKMYLEKTDFEIVALKIMYYTKDETVNARINKEKKAIRKILPKLLEIRAFKYTELVVQMPNGVKGTDVPIFGSLAIYPAYSFGCKEIIIGWVKDIRHGQSKYVAKKHELLNKISSLYFEGSKGMWNWFPIFVLSDFYGDKKVYIDYLGEMVLETWFCRFPKRAGKRNGCGVCVACRHIKKILPETILI